MIIRDAMGDLQDLELVLSSRTEKLTVEEEDILRGWKTQAKRYSRVGCGFGCVLTLLVTPTLSYRSRFYLALGAGTLCAFLGHRLSVESYIDRILAMDDSPMQRELATIMLKKYSNDPLVLPRLSKHFFTEEVYKDSSADKPIYRWRFRNVFGNPIVHSQSESYTKETDSKKYDFSLSTIFKPKQADVQSSSYMLKNPLDFLFGHPESAEDNLHHIDSSILSERKRRRENRRRKSEMRDEEDSDI